MKMRDAAAEDLPAIAEIYNTNTPTRVYVHPDHQGEGLGRCLVGEAIRRSPELGTNTLTAGIFAHNGASVALFEGFGFERWAHLPQVAELDGVERDLLVLGLKVET